MNRFLFCDSEGPAGVNAGGWAGKDTESARKMRELGVAVRVSGSAPLRLSRKTAARLFRAVDAARGMNASGEEGSEDVKALARGGRVMEAFLRQTRQEGGARLPARKGIPRILAVAESLTEGGMGEADVSRLVSGISAFDDVQALTMSEIWAFPAAVRIVIAGGMADAAERIAENARCRLAAERWLARPGKRIPDRSPAFFERALRLADDGKRADARTALEAELGRMGKTEAGMIALARAQAARDAARLEGLMAFKRFIDGLDWRKCFERISRVEAQLRLDPSDVYGNMDDASRDAVRRRVSVMAEKLRVEEITVVRHALTEAENSLRGGEGLRGSVCWWLMTDEGADALTASMGLGAKGIPRRIPDPSGRICVGVIIAAAALFTGLWLLWIDDPLLILPGIPVAWMAANAVIGRVYAKLFPPAGLLRMNAEDVPDEWRTLVVMPVLLSSPERAREMCARLESHGCLEKDRNIRFLLLGDFSDNAQPKRPEDAAILNAARGAIGEMNRRAGWEKYGYIHRPRSFMKADRRWMGFDRKRGALMALNRLLMDVPGAEDAFGAEGGACAWLKEGFRFVVTLDGDTRMLPGAVRSLIGAMAHPLNRRRENGGYGILQPNMEMTPSACANEFVRLFAGSGGVNTYPVNISGFWQDLTGEGMFQGKGIYDVRAFYEALEGALPEGRILSHDLIEGAIARAGSVGDVSFFDGYPAGLSALMMRMNRWIRGDWQLLPFIFSKKALPGGRRLTGPQRLRMADNLIRSLYAPALLAAFVLSIWTGSVNGFCAAAGLAYLDPILRIGSRDGLKWRRATAQLALLPLTAWHAVDAVIRTLWRLFVSGRHMLDWVTAADAESVRGNTALPGRLAALLLVPGLLSRGWIAASAALAALFLVGPGWIRDMEATPAGGTGALSREDIAGLMTVARKTWRFFESCVPGNGLPPDNVQIDPPKEPEPRTSPTNIGLYLTSCLAARRMGFIRKEEMLCRMGAVMDSLHSMEKWRGHLFNWYDIRTLAPLSPRYVSSVDSGNLAACLMLTASALSGMDDEACLFLAEQMSQTARSMDFSGLFDRERGLFHIGFDADTGRLSAARYDMLASEARILSFAAIMLGQADVRHWQRLSRTAAHAAGGAALASWSGTMFEYLMPEIFMPTPAHSLIGESCRLAVKAQKRHGMARKRPWGVSESGHHDFEGDMRYSYRAFGMKALALSGDVREDVVAPYASLLALSVDPAGAAENAGRMQALGWADDMGFFEAADYSHATPDGKPALVKSHMAHHQGMILCALCNALCGNYLSEAFMAIPEAQAIGLLLQEKPYSDKGFRPDEAAGKIRGTAFSQRHPGEGKRNGTPARCGI